MGNKHSYLLKDPELLPSKTKFSKTELKILCNIFSDLSARDHGVVTKESFLSFFSLTGLWGERIFKSFDVKCKGHLSFPDFLNGLSLYCKCTEDEKIRLLFSLYDIDGDGYIQKKELITMLYNFPKPFLKQIFDALSPAQEKKIELFHEEKNTRTIASFEKEDKFTTRTGFFKKLTQVECHVEENQEENPRGSSCQDVNDLSVAEEKLQHSTKPIVFRDLPLCFQNVKFNESKILNEIDYRESEKTNQIQTFLNEEFHSNSHPTSIRKSSEKPTSPSRRRGFSSKELAAAIHLEDLPATSLEELSGVLSPTGPKTDKKPQSLEAATSPNTKIKGYASYIFNYYINERNSDKMSFPEFTEWTKQNRMIFKIFDDIFHQELWTTINFEKNDRRTSHQTHVTEGSASMRESRYFERGFSLKEEDNYCKFKFGNCLASEIQIAGTLYKKEKSSWARKYVELRGSFLIYYSNQEQKQCEGILFLNGCNIETWENADKSRKKYGFEISYPRESYKPHSFYCLELSNFEEWMNYLKAFQSASINDLYTFHEQLGTGKFSTVFRATSKKENGEEFAIKVINKDKLSDSEKQSILSESSVMKVLEHPTTIKLFETLEVENNIFIIMELAKDGDLFDYVLSKGFLEEYEASYIMQRLLTSVNYLHHMGIVHRDLKPENIMISRDSDSKSTIKEIKIIDFGFSKFLCSKDLIKEACGTPNYLAPEILKETGYDKKVDIFSLGVIMYFLLKGCLPFDASGVGNILKKTFKIEAPMDCAHWENISVEGKDLLEKLLQKDPKNRIEIEEALKHPWIQQRENLKKYEGVNAKSQPNQEGIKI